MATYTYRAYDLLSGKFLMDLPSTGGSYTETLNDPGSGSLTVPLTPRVMHLAAGQYVDPGYIYNAYNWDVGLIYQATIPKRTALYIDRDGVLVWGGIIDSRRPGDGSLSLNVSGFLSYFANRRLRTDMDMLGTEQCTIARRMLQYALDVTYQGRPVGGMGGMSIVAPNTGVLRDVIITGSQRSVVLEQVMTLVGLSGGFDIDVAVAYDPATGAPTKTCRMWYPRKGRDAATSPIVWEYETGTDNPGGVLADYEWPQDGSNMVTLMLSRGDPTDFPVMSEVWADSLLVNGWPLLEDEFIWQGEQGVIGNGVIDDQALLDERTKALLAVRGGLATTPTVTLRPGINPGDYQVGDWVRVNITDPMRYPSPSPGVPGLSESVRVVGRTVTPAIGDGDESTSVSLHTVADEALEHP